MEIVSVEDVKSRMGLPDELLEADAAIESALAAAENYIVGILDTALEYHTDNTDTYHIVKDYFPATPGGMFRLRLSQAFVEAGSITVTVGDVLTSMVAMSTEDWNVDLQHGVVYVDQAHVDRFVTVTYNAGLQVGDTLPQWLKEAVLAYVPGVLNTMQITNREDEYKTTLEQSRDYAGNIMAPHMRGTAFHYRPIWSAITAGA